MISRDEIKHIAQLAHLELEEEQLEKFTDQLGSVIDSFEKLDELDTEGVEPTAYTVPMKNIMREDKVEESYSQEDILANAPDKKKGHFRVPPISAEE